jgi:WD40 repeat protein
LLVIKPGRPNDTLAVSGDGKRLAVGSDSTKLTVWDADSGKSLLTLDAGYSTVNAAFSADGSLIAVCSGGVDDILAPFDFRLFPKPLGLAGPNHLLTE